MAIEMSLEESVGGRQETGRCVPGLGLCGWVGILVDPLAGCIEQCIERQLEPALVSRGLATETGSYRWRWICLDRGPRLHGQCAECKEPPREPKKKVVLTGSEGRYRVPGWWELHGCLSWCEGRPSGLLHMAISGERGW